MATIKEQPKTINLGNRTAKRIWYYEDGTIYRHDYIKNSLYHREDGPTDIWYNTGGRSYDEYYFLNGKELNKQQFEKELLKKKLELL